MTAFGSIVLSGLVAGSIYALTALGVVTTYKVTKVLNFAQGATAAIASYIAWDWVASTRLPPWTALFVAMIAGAAAGWITERLAVRPLLRYGILAPVLATLGISLVVEGVIETIWGATPRPFPEFVGAGNINIFGASITRTNMAIIVVAAIAMIVLYVIFERSDAGRRIRASFENQDAAKLCGVNVPLTIGITWGIAGALMGLAGVLASQQTYLSPSLNQNLLLFSLIAVAIGGFQSLPGAVIGGLIVGIAEAVFAGYISSGYSETLLLGILLVMLLVLPKGILGGFTQLKRSRREAGSDQLLLLRADSASLSNVRPTVKIVGLVGFAVILGGSPLVFGAAIVVGLTTAAAYAVIVLSYVVVTGFSGQVSLGQGALALVGAYGAVYLGIHFHLNFIIAIVGGSLIAGLVGLVFAIPLVRTKGFYFAIATTALVLIVPSLILNTPVSLVGGSDGLASPTMNLFGMSLGGTDAIYYVAIIVFVVVAAALKLVSGRLFVLRLQALRDDEIGAEASGIRVRWYRVGAFTVGAAIAGVGGGVFAFAAGFISTSDFGFTTSVLLQFAVVMGGLMSIYGAMLGASVIALIPVLFSSYAALGEIAYGVIAYGVMLLMPNGLGDVVKRGYDWLCRSDVMNRRAKDAVRKGTDASEQGGSTVQRETKGNGTSEVVADGYLK